MYEKFWKRFIDIVASLLALAILSPVLLVLIIVGVSYLFTPDLECQYVIGHNAHKPMVVMILLHSLQLNA